MNILLTCIGRRGYIVDFFKAALKGRGRVFACDSSADAPGLKRADCACVVPPINSVCYVDTLLEIREHKIASLIPAFEPELPLLAAHRDRFQKISTTVLVSSMGVVETCYDKLAMADFLKRCGLAAPVSYFSSAEAGTAIANGEAKFPFIVKARWGVSSLENQYAHDEEELEMVHRLIKKRLDRTFLGPLNATDSARCILIQPQLAGQEYGLDIINDLKGDYVCTFAKRKLRMRAGATDRAVTSDSLQLQALGREVGEKLRHVGMMDCDLFMSEGGECTIIDLNPRLGGGYPFSHAAGANYPLALIAWLDGAQPSRDWLEVAPSVLASRCDDIEILSDMGRNLASIESWANADEIDESTRFASERI